MTTTWQLKYWNSMHIHNNSVSYCIIYTGWCKKRPESFVTIMVHVLYTEKFLFADL